MNMAVEQTNTRGGSYSDSNQTRKNWWAGRQNTWICLTVKQRKPQKLKKKKGGGKAYEKRVAPLRVIVEGWKVNERKMHQEKHC